MKRGPSMEYVRTLFRHGGRNSVYRLTNGDYAVEVGLKKHTFTPKEGEIVDCVVTDIFRQCVYVELTTSSYHNDRRTIEFTPNHERQFF